MSRALCPIERATAPSPWARPIQRATSPRAIAVKKRANGPGPLRTARGAGRPFGALLPREGVDFLVVVLRDRVLEPDPEAFARDVLLLRDPGGEDVRVAMLATLGESHHSLRDHTSACRSLA
ncbi:hypothetical protein GCM10009668_37980 [Nocardioides dubius]|uniref:Uncharacterized protein n=1 Tax=Nocardioides dubius TaxID=317019 RepID=A0ABP4ELH6_9ACTN